MKLKWQQAPVKTQWGDDMVVASVAIDKDHTLSLYCERDQAPKVDAMLAQRTWVGLTDDEKRSVCRVGPVYAPDGVVTRNPLEYRKELQGVALMAVRQAEAKLRSKNEDRN
jgi:hypothetical protein